MHQFFRNSIQVVRNIISGNDLFLTGEAGAPSSPPDDIDITTYQALRLDKANAALWAYVNIGGAAWRRIGSLSGAPIVLTAYDHAHPAVADGVTVGADGVTTTFTGGEDVVKAWWLVNFDLLGPAANVTVDFSYISIASGGGAAGSAGVWTGSTNYATLDGTQRTSVGSSSSNQPLHSSASFARPSGRKIVQLSIACAGDEEQAPRGGRGFVIVLTPTD